jgi:hypothetical protein
MNEKLSLAIEAIRKWETSLWEIGDALVAECGPPSKRGNERVKAAQAFLLQEGFPYKLSYLRSLRNVAYRFQTSQRMSGIAWGVHRTAGTPEMLHAIINGTPEGTKITEEYVRKIRRAWLHRKRWEKKNASASPL